MPNSETIRGRFGLSRLLLIKVFPAIRDLLNFHCRAKGFHGGFSELSRERAEGNLHS